MNKIEILFQPQKMSKLLKGDMLLSFCYQELKKSNKNVSEEEILEVLFITYILEDAAMEVQYTNC